MPMIHEPQGNLIVVEHLVKKTTASGLILPDQEMGASPELPRCRVIRVNKYAQDLKPGDIILLKYAQGYPITESTGVRGPDGAVIENKYILIETEAIAAIEREG